ncbi:hypothetical protein ACIA8O_11680 [Kitasatospora sp. NPDC051853]|uniref:hypothetical protein n=1 Tax=Kitasatospora sp. NPDC051853 TaxID=3364058 RepID=UPI00378EBFF4
MTDHQLPSGEDQLENELRSRLHQAVARLEPDPAALPRLRQEVPRRRARHRTTWTTAAAAVLLSAAAWPTIQGVQGLDLSGGPVESPTVGAAPKATGILRPSPSGTTRPVPQAPQSPGSPSPVTESPSATAAPVPQTSTTATATGGPGGTPTPTAVAPACTAADLGRPSVSVGQPDAAGNVYGWFRVQNVSARTCQLGGGGAVSSDQARIRVAAHTAGGPATALPAPTSNGPLLLAPSTAYLVRFGWVPETACPAPTPAPGPSAGAAPEKGEAAKARAAAPAPSGSAAPSEGPGPDPTPTPTPTPTPPPGPETTLLLTHVPDPGGQPVSATIPNACTGTVYRTAPEHDQPTASPTP